MKILLLFMCMPFFLVMAEQARAENKDLAIEVKAKKSTYFIGEPVVLDLKLTNLTNEQVDISFDYPRHMGLHFFCNDVGVDRSPFSPLFSSDYRVIYFYLQPYQAYEISFVLNRFILLKNPKKYKIKYTASYISKLP